MSETKKDQNEVRRRRQEAIQQSRKEAKQDRINKRRGGNTSSSTNLSSNSQSTVASMVSAMANETSIATSALAVAQTENHTNNDETNNTTVLPDVAISNELLDLRSGMISNDEEEQLRCVRAVRTMLSLERNPPIQQVIEGGFVAPLVQFLSHSNHSLQFEATWALTNIASGSSVQTQAIIEAGVIPLFIGLTTSTHYDCVEQAVWGLGNIAGDSPHSRDIVLNELGLEALLSLFDRFSRSSRPPITLVRNLAWSVSNLCRGKPSPDWQHVQSALPLLATLLQHEDNEVVADTCWALSYLSDGENHKIQAVIDVGVCPRLVQLMRSSVTTLVLPALRTVGNIVTGDDEQTHAMVSLNVLPCLGELLLNPRRSIQKEACWAISNITAGNTEQIQMVIAAGLIPSLISILESESNFDVKKEAAWAIANATAGGSSDQMKFLVHCRCLVVMGALLTCQDASVVSVCLEAFDNILSVGKKDALETYGADLAKNADNLMARELEKVPGVMAALQQLTRHLNTSVTQKVEQVLAYYDSNRDQTHHSTASIRSTTLLPYYSRPRPRPRLFSFSTLDP